MDVAWLPERVGHLIKEWQQNWEVAVDCLESLRPIIGLQRTSAAADSTARKAAAALYQQVPSTALLELAQTQTAAAPPSIDLPSMQAEYIVLQEAAQALQDGLAGMKTCYQQGMAAIQLEADESSRNQGLQPHLASTMGLHHGQHFNSLQQEPVEVFDSRLHELLPSDASPDAVDGSNITQADTIVGHQHGVEDQSQDMPLDISTPDQAGAAAEPGVTVLEPAELLVLLGDICAAYERQLHMLALICGSLNLSSPQPVLETYITFMKLQPFTDERVVQALQVQLAPGVQTT